MSINVQTTGDHDDPDLNTTINTTPLVDVMLVLLIIFLVTIPVIVKVVPVNLPNARNIATTTKPENIVIAVTSDGTTFYNNQPITGDVVVSLRDRFVGCAHGARWRPAIRCRKSISAVTRTRPSGRSAGWCWRPRKRASRKSGS